MNRYQFLHIGKTGGTTVRKVLRSLPDEYRSRFHILSHVTLAQAIEKHPGMPVFFCVREPETLFVSGFNSRRRAGRPTYDRPWTRREQVAFSRFDTPNELAEALSAREPELKASAEQAMFQITHVRQGLRRYLRNVDFLEQHRDKIAFILLQERLADDLQAFAERIGVPLELAEVSPSRRFHESLGGAETELSALGLENIKGWYRLHREIYDWCVEFRERTLAGG